MPGLNREVFMSLTPGFVGKNLQDAAIEAGCSPGSLRARFSREGYDVKIRKNIIEEIAHYGMGPDIREEIKEEMELETRPDKNHLEPLGYKEPTVIRLPPGEYFEMISYFRSRNHRRCRS